MKTINQSLTDAQVIASLQEGQSIERAVRFLYHTHFANLDKYIRRNSGTHQDAEDYFHETLVVFIELVRQGKFRGHSSIKTLLYAIMRNLWCNELKRRNRAQLSGKEFFEKLEKTTYHPHQHFPHEREVQMLELMELLQDNYRKVLMLYYYEEMPMKQIFKVMGYKSEQVARNMKCKGMKKLHELYQHRHTFQPAYQE